MASIRYTDDHEIITFTSLQGATAELEERGFTIDPTPCPLTPSSDIVDRAHHIDGDADGTLYVHHDGTCWAVFGL